MRAKMRHHHTAIQHRTFPRLNGHLDVLAGDRIRNASHFCPKYIRVQQRDALHLTRKDLQPTNVQHLRRASHNLYIVVVSLDDVTCIVPSVDKW